MLTRVALLVALWASTIAGAFVAGRAVERHAWSIAPPAERQSWRAKEGTMQDRVREADAAIALDPNYLGGYYWKARAYFEDARPREAVQALGEGLRASGAAQSLALMSAAKRDAGMPDEAEVLGRCCRLLSWPTDGR